MPDPDVGGRFKRLCDLRGDVRATPLPDVGLHPAEPAVLLVRHVVGHPVKRPMRGEKRDPFHAH